MVQHIIVIRGSPGIGKSTIAKQLATHIPGNVSVVDIDVLRYKLIPKRSEEFNDHNLVYRNLMDICKNTLNEGLSIIIEGILASKDEKGSLRIDEFEKFSGPEIKVTRLFLKGSKETQELRLKKGDKQLSSNKIQEWTQLANSTLTKKDCVIDTNDKAKGTIIGDILKIIKNQE
jgi:predicted ABC-type ATPase|tara:strand:+ start:2383 stop:2904 length:522 start_codon:yes stop_codon:yes gene_type:complete